MGDDGDYQIKMTDMGYAYSDYIGVSGLEYTMEAYLTGATNEHPKLICLNYSAENPLADGMKLGLWKKLMKLLPNGCDFRPSTPLYSQLKLD